MAEKISVEDEKKLHTIKKHLDEIKEKQVLNADLNNLKNRIVDNLSELTTPLAIFIRDSKLLEEEIIEIIKDPDLAHIFNDPLYHKIEQQIKTSNNRFLMQERINQLMSQFLVSVLDEVNNISKSTAQTEFRPEDRGTPTMTQEEINDLVGKVTLLVAKFPEYSSSKKKVLLYTMNKWANNKERFTIIEGTIEKIMGEKNALAKYREELAKAQEDNANG